MADLRDALKRSGLVNDKQARKLAHEEKARKKKLGRKGLDEERAEKEAEARQKQAAQREQDRQRESAKLAKRKQREESAALAQIVRDHALTSGVMGARRFHFVTREGKIPYLDVADEIARGLERGELAICEMPGATPEEFVLLDARHARRVRAIDADVVRFFNTDNA